MRKVHFTDFNFQTDAEMYRQEEDRGMEEDEEMFNMEVPVENKVPAVIILRNCRLLYYRFTRYTINSAPESRSSSIEFIPDTSGTSTTRLTMTLIILPPKSCKDTSSTYFILICSTKPKRQHTRYSLVHLRTHAHSCSMRAHPTKMLLLR